MKKIMYCVAILLMAGCNTDEKKIETVAYSYLDAMGNYKIDDARPYASAETCEKTLDVLLHHIMPKVDTGFIVSNTPATIEVLKVSKTSDSTATVDYKKTTPIQVQNGTLDMVKEAGEWKANVIIALSPMFTQDMSDSTALLKRYDSMKGKLKPVVKEEK